MDWFVVIFFFGCMKFFFVWRKFLSFERVFLVEEVINFKSSFLWFLIFVELNLGNYKEFYFRFKFRVGFGF